MKAFTLTLLAVTLARMLCAAEPKSISTSPDGKYSIAVEQDEQLGLVFRWWQLQPEHLLLQIKSSYQPASPNDTSARVDTEAAQVHWSSDSRFVAIDEYNLRFKGAVFAATLTAPEKAEQLNIPLGDIVKVAGERWARFRLYVGTGWLADGGLSLTLVGSAFADKIAGEERIEGDIGYDIVVKPVQALVITSLRGNAE